MAAAWPAAASSYSFYNKVDEEIEMSWKTMWIEGDRLYLVNQDLAAAGYDTIREASFASNISNAYNGEADRFLAMRASMSEEQAAVNADRHRSWESS